MCTSPGKKIKRAISLILPKKNDKAKNKKKTKKNCIWKYDLDS